MGCSDSRVTIITPTTQLIAPTTDSAEDRRNFSLDAIPANKEDVTLIWLDKNIDDNVIDFQNTLTSLRKINDFILTYTNVDLCLEYINNVQNEKLFIILSGSLGKDVLPQINSIETVGSICIFCSNDQLYRDYINQYSKVMDIVTDQEQLIKSIQHQLQLMSKQSIAFNLFDKKQKSTKDLTQDSASFLWFQLLLNVLKQMSQTEKSKQEMLKTCEDYYRGNKTELANIERFRKTYTSDNAIQWYTDETFVYRLLNKALRTEDIEALYLLRFFVIDLSKQLEAESKLNPENTTVTLYRGQQMFAAEFEKLQQSTGSLISTNGFFSTTRSIKVALNFAKNNLKAMPEKEFKIVLFEIRANSNSKTNIFADIEKYSVIKGEEEVLFNIGSVFKIQNIYFDRQMNVWKIDMITTNEGMEDVWEFVNKMNAERTGDKASYAFGELLVEMGQYSKAESYFRMKLKEYEKDSLEAAQYYDGIGFLMDRQGEFLNALEYFTLAYEIKKKFLKENDIDLSYSLYHMGIINYHCHRYDEAIELLTKALTLNPEYDSALQMLGKAYRKKNEFDNALTYLNKSLELTREIYPPNHPEIAYVMWAIADVYEDKGNADISLKYYLEIFEMFQKSLPLGHDHFSRLTTAIMSSYEIKGESANALSFCRKVLDMQQKQLYENHPSIAITLGQIGDLVAKDDLQESLHYHEKALKIFQICQPPQYNEMAICIGRIGNLCEKMGKYDKALIYYFQQLDIAKRLRVSDDPEIARIFWDISTTYEQQDKYVDALKYAMHSLQIYESRCSSDDPRVSQMRMYVDHLQKKVTEL